MPNSELEKYRNRIREIKIQFADEANPVPVGDKWTFIAKNADAVRCSLDNPASTIINIRIGRNGRIGPHTHKKHSKQVHVIDGRVFDFVNNKHYNSGDVFNIKAGQRHGVESDYALLTVVYRPAFNE